MDPLDFDNKEREINTPLVDDLKETNDGSVLSAMISESRYQQWRYEKYDAYDALDFPDFKATPYRLSQLKDNK